MKTISDYLVCEEKDVRDYLLVGKLPLPKESMEIFYEYYETDEITDLNICRFWDALWYSYLRETSECSQTWFDIFGNHDLLNDLLKVLDMNDWIQSIILGNYACIQLKNDKILEFISKEELNEIRRKYKTNKYKLKNRDKVIYDLVKNNNIIKKTGLVRKGFAKCTKNLFSFDTELMEEHIEPIANNVLKGLELDMKEVSYEEIVIELLALVSQSNEKYTLERNYSDSRGRAVFQCCKRVFNPISSKEARSLMICKPNKILAKDKDTLANIYAFIAELVGAKCIGGKYEDKIKAGKKAYLDKYNPHKNNPDKLYAYLWLTRIYRDLDKLFELGALDWNIPVEVDSTASVLQHIGCLTNNHEWMFQTNIIGEELGDIWSADPEVKRDFVKMYITRYIYGSDKSPKQILDDEKEIYTKEDINRINNVTKKGIFNQGLEFRNYILENVKPEDNMLVKIWNDEFNISCIRYDKTKGIIRKYYIYNTEHGDYKTITRTIYEISDLNRFKRYFVTLLV